jgi:hypothetical protein
LRTRKAEYEATKQRFFAAKLSNEEIEDRLDPQEKYIIRLQRDLMALLQKGQEVNEASKGILGLFDNPAPPAAPNEEQRAVFSNQMKQLKKMLSLYRPKKTSPPSQPTRFKSALLQAEYSKGELSTFKFSLLSDFFARATRFLAHRI